MPGTLTYAGWEDLAEGAEREIAVGPLTRTDLVRFAGASGDFNPNHHDEIYAIQSGFDKPFAHGMLQGGYLGQLLTEWLGPRRSGPSASASAGRPGRGTPSPAGRGWSAATRRAGSSASRSRPRPSTRTARSSSRPGPRPRPRAELYKGPGRQGER